MSSPGHRLGEVRAGERHRALADDHRHEVGESRDVGGARGARAEHRRDHRDDARHLDLLAEEVARAGEERARRLLDAGAGRVEQPDQGHALLQRDLAKARDLQLAGHAHRAGHHGEVVGGDRDGAAVDLAPAGDDAVGGRVLALHRSSARSAGARGCPSRRRCPRRPGGRGARARSACRASAAFRSSRRRRPASPSRGARGGRGPATASRSPGPRPSRRAPRRPRLRARSWASRWLRSCLPFHSGSRFSKNAVTPSIASSV